MLRVSDLTLQGANGGIALCLKGHVAIGRAIVREMQSGASSSLHLGHELRPQIGVEA
jgi:hypothetical protein